MAFFSGWSPKNPADKDDFETSLERLKTVPDFLERVIDAVEGTDLPGALAQALPWWAGALGESVAEVLPPVKFVISLFEKLGRVDDPHQLGMLACTLAYQRALELALKRIGLEGKVKVDKKRLRRAQKSDSYDLTGFTFSSALNHRFVLESDQFLDGFVDALGADANFGRRLKGEVHRAFVPALKEILCDGGTREKFAPFHDLLKIDQKEARAYDALRRHAQTQRLLFDKEPLLGHEGFALKDVYIPMDCGSLTWQEIEPRGRSQGERRPVDPASEDAGGRAPLLETLMALPADPEFDEAILIQGPAGAGKSTFTLRLCQELEDRGLAPIRIELRNLDTRGRPVRQTLPEAVEIGLGKDERWFRDGDLFLDWKIFDEAVDLDNGQRIARHVLILDGWDEISVGSPLGFHLEIERLLRDLRAELFERRNLPVRLILAGRPTDAIERGGLLRPETRILTLRPFRPDQLEAFMTRAGGVTGFHAGEAKRRAIVTRYEKAFAADRQRSVTSTDLDVLGLPLLAFLTLSLLAEATENVDELLASPTTLYRCLVDLVIGKGGKVDPEFDPTGRAILTGDELRDLLRRTAEAMTHLGTENIAREELAVRLGFGGEELDERVSETTQDNKLTRLLISFFFKGGRRELGCEFCHKSFREYLFAERIVERLKEYGRVAAEALPERPRELYWKDFDADDPRRAFAHELAELLGPVWITREVGRHLEALIEWEIGRAVGNAKGTKTAGTTTAALDPGAWLRIRAGLADLWDWWGEGVHLRPQPRRKPRSRELEWDEPVAARIAREIRPRSQPDTITPPPRTTSIDGHLGEGLCRLAVAVHRQLIDLPSPEAPRRYQVKRSEAAEGPVTFAPSGEEHSYFRTYICRINAAGFRPEGEFPSDMDLSHANFSNADLFSTSFIEANLSHANLSRAFLIRALFISAKLSHADLSHAVLSNADFYEANLSNANLSNTDLIRADFSEANLSGADLSDADLSDADLSDADLSKAELSEANLSDARYVARKWLKASERQRHKTESAASQPPR